MDHQKQEFLLWKQTIELHRKTITMIQTDQSTVSLPFTGVFVTKTTLWKSFLKGKMDAMLGFSTKGLNNIDQDFLLSISGTIWSEILDLTEQSLKTVFTGRVSSGEKDAAGKLIYKSTRSREAAERIGDALGVPWNSFGTSDALRAYFKGSAFVISCAKWKKQAAKLRAEHASPAPAPAPAPVPAPAPAPVPAPVPQPAPPPPVELVVGVPVVERLVGVLAPPPTEEAKTPAAAPTPPEPTPPDPPTPPEAPPVEDAVASPPASARKDKRSKPPPEEAKPPPAPKKAKHATPGNDACSTDLEAMLVAKFNECRARARAEKATLFPQGVVRANLANIDGFVFFSLIRTTGKSAGSTDGYVEVEKGSRAERLVQAAGKKSARFRSAPDIAAFFAALADKQIDIGSIA